MSETSSGINLERFEELSDGDPSSLKELIELYLNKTAEQVSELEETIHSRDGARGARVAHGLVGANLMVGMNSMVPTLRLMESHLEKGEFSKAQPLYSQLLKKFEAIQSVLGKKVQP